MLLSLLLLVVAVGISYEGLFANEAVDIKAFGVSAFLLLMAAIPWATSRHAVSPKFILWLGSFGLVGFSILTVAEEINFPMSCSGRRREMVCHLINFLYETGGKYLASLPFWVLSIICIYYAYSYKGKSRET